MSPTAASSASTNKSKTSSTTRSTGGRSKRAGSNAASKGGSKSGASNRTGGTATVKGRTASETSGRDRRRQSGTPKDRRRPNGRIDENREPAPPRPAKARTEPSEPPDLEGVAPVKPTFTRRRRRSLSMPAFGTSGLGSRLRALSPRGLVGRLGRSGRRARVGGVAPFVAPRGRLGRRLRMRELGKVGFVAVSPHKQKLRHRILPRTVIGIAGLLMAAGVGAAFSGAAFYAYYDNRLAENERTVARFVEGFDQQFTDAAGALDEMRADAVGSIRGELAPLEGYVEDTRAVVNLPATAGPSVWLVETRDEGGRLTTGSAFAIIGHRGGTALVTSYSVVRAATTQPGPVIELVKGQERVAATLWAWDEVRDLALLVTDRVIPVLELAGNGEQLRSVGAPVYALSGYGSQGATASPGTLLDHSGIGLQHTAPVGSLFVGGPLLTGDGAVVGMASTAYRPLAVDPGAVGQAPDVAGICVTILRCSEVEDELDIDVAGG